MFSTHPTLFLLPSILLYTTTLLASAQTAQTSPPNPLYIFQYPIHTPTENLTVGWNDTIEVSWTVSDLGRSENFSTVVQVQCWPRSNGTGVDPAEVLLSSPPIYTTNLTSGTPLPPSTTSFSVQVAGFYQYSPCMMVLLSNSTGSNEGDGMVGSAPFGISKHKVNEDVNGTTWSVGRPAPVMVLEGGAAGTATSAPSGGAGATATSAPSGSGAVAVRMGWRNVCAVVVAAAVLVALG